MDGLNVYAFVGGNPATDVDMGGFQKKKSSKKSIGLKSIRVKKKPGDIMARIRRLTSAVSNATQHFFGAKAYKAGTVRYHWKGERDTNQKTSGISPHVTSRSQQDWSGDQKNKRQALGAHLTSRGVTGIASGQSSTPPRTAEVSHIIAASFHAPNDELSAVPASVHQNTEWLAIESGIKTLIKQGKSPILKATGYVHAGGTFKGTLKAARYKIYINGKKVFDHVSEGFRGNIDEDEYNLLEGRVSNLNHSSSSVSLHPFSRTKGLSGSAPVFVNSGNPASVSNKMFTDLRDELKQVV